MQVNFTNNSQQNIKTQNWRNWKSQKAPVTEVATDNLVRPQAAKGHLVKAGLLATPKSVVKGLVYDVTSFANAATGKANDHQLGKLNDVGMKLGALGLAGYLMTKKATPKTKAMELVGVATFFAAMKFWPKLAISLPAKLIHGFDPNQEYVDSQGRQKSFFQDAQYTPWDLYSNEEMQKIGDKLGVDNDLQNRNEVTQLKMKKIASQSNTIWMLTAGIMSAVGSALLSNKAEKVVGSVQDKQNNKKADELLRNFDKVVAQRAQKSTMMANFDKVMSANKDKKVDEKLLNTVTDFLAKGFDPLTKDGIAQDIKNMLATTDVIADTNVVNKVSDKVSEKLNNKYGEEKALKFIPTAEELTAALENKALFGRVLNEDEMVAARGVMANLAMQKAKEAGLAINDLKYVKKEVMQIADSGLKSNVAAILDDATIEKVKSIATTINDLNVKASVLDDYAQYKVADKPETVIANYWNDTAESLIKTLKIDFKQLEEVRNNRELVQDMLRNKIEEVTSNDVEYARVIGEIASNIAKLDEKINPEDTKKYLDKVTKTYDDASGTLYNQGMHETADRLTAYGVGAKGSLKRVKQSYYQERIAGVKNSFARLISTLDTYRRISKGDFKAAVNGLPREAQEGLLELVKQTTLQGHSSDHSIKFYFNRNSNPATDMSDVEIKDGKVVNKYYKKNEGVDVPQDADFYQRAMKLMYNSPMDKVTLDALRKAGIESQVNNYNREVFDKIGGAEYFTKPQHRTGGNDASSEYKFLLLGVAPDEMFTKTVQQTYNTQKWGNTFGTVGAVVTGLTMLSQLFLGKGKVGK